MIKKLLISILCFTIVQSTKAQNNAPIPNRGCASGVPDQAWEAELQKQIAAFKAASVNGKTQMGAYSIPVIFHVIHGGEAVGTFPNLAQGQLNSQITVLNQDYSGTGLNISNYPSGAFAAFASAAGLSGASVDGSGRVAIANTDIQFCLAEKDTAGNNLVEPGIERINYSSKGWVNPNTFSSISSFQNFINNTVKPQTIWNVSKYLNIWITDENVGSVGLLGYATFPVTSGLTGLSGPYGNSSNDGFWAYAKCLGSALIFPAGSYLAPFDRGRTCTHEIGHWLGLRHIWGDAGQCGATDNCVDTPPQQGGSSSPAGCTYGVPTYPQNANTCTRPDGIASANISNVNGDMFMNFMDYTDDIAMYMFTADQTTRMQTAMANCPYRKFLGTHGLSCSFVGIKEKMAFDKNVTIMPNPSSGLVSVTVTLPNTKSLNITVTNALGQLISNTDFNEVNSTLFTIDLSANGSGVYFVSIANGEERAVKKIVITK